MASSTTPRRPVVSWQGRTPRTSATRGSRTPSQRSRQGPLAAPVNSYREREYDNHGTPSSTSTADLLNDSPSFRSAQDDFGAVLDSTLEGVIDDMRNLANQENGDDNDDYYDSNDVVDDEGSRHIIEEDNMSVSLSSNVESVTHLARRREPQSSRAVSQSQPSQQSPPLTRIRSRRRNGNSGRRIPRHNNEDGGRRTTKYARGRDSSSSPSL